ncbi:MAG: gamma-glutamyltransferase [bacterium]|nr:MAG: gamma-glutamyltransferase [bacterium]
MVVTASPHASIAGQEILSRGGNAVDAAVAVGFALAVTYPAAGNIGGGGFMLIHLQGGETELIDYRETAPFSASRDMYLDDEGMVIPNESTLGHRSCGVPGSVSGLYLAHVLYGSVDWEELLQPAIDLARDGFIVDDHLARSLRRLQKYVDHFRGLRKYMRDDVTTLEAGDLLVQPLLAKTLERIAESGPDGFYFGETADCIVKEMKRGRGLITHIDLESYEAMTRLPLRQNYRGYEIISAPPPSSGGAILIEILNILEGYDLRKDGYRSEETIAHIVEAQRRAYADRAQYYGDPDYTSISLSVLLSKNYAKFLRSGIGDLATPSEDCNGGGLERYESEETTHYSIIDPHGNAVATTTTLNGAYGSKVVVDGCGFLLNNEMDDFAIKPGAPNMYGLTGGQANEIAPAKRMLSSMAPTIVLKEDSIFSILGTPGGPTIITTVAQILLNIIDFGMSIEEAVAQKRFHHQWLPDSIFYEKGCFSDILITVLEKRGYRFKMRSSPIGDAQVIVVGDSLITGVSDPRGGGCAAGLGIIESSDH